MTEITGTMVAELRKKTGYGMMDCKQALVDSDGNVEKAIELLRNKVLPHGQKAVATSSEQRCYTVRNVVWGGIE